MSNRESFIFFRITSALSAGISFREAPLCSASMPLILVHPRNAKENRSCVSMLRYQKRRNPDDRVSSEATNSPTLTHDRAIEHDRIGFHSRITLGVHVDRFIEHTLAPLGSTPRFTPRVARYHRGHADRVRLDTGIPTRGAQYPHPLQE